MKIRVVLTIALTGALLAASCGSKRLPKGVMTEEQMVEFLSEAYLIEGFYAVETNFNHDTLAEQAQADYAELLKRCELTPEQVEASFAYYADHTMQYAAIHQRVVKRLDEEAR